MKKEIKERIELIILNNSNIEKIKSILDDNIGSVYIKVNLLELSNTRELLVNKDYTTRLMVIDNNKEVLYYIFGKKKGNKGVFKEHCKNTVIRSESYIDKLINTSSNENDLVITDDLDILKNINTKNRIGRKI
jgi:hypothetical protein